MATTHSQAQGPDDHDDQTLPNAAATAAAEEMATTEAADGAQGDPAETFSLHRSTRLKGYITLLTAAIYNFISAREKVLLDSATNQGIENVCTYVHNLRNLFRTPPGDVKRLRLSMSVAMITAIITGFIVIIHLDKVTPMRKFWRAMFGNGSIGELIILTLLTLMWGVTTWFNTSIRGPAGEGNDQFNLYFTSWLCLWCSFWTLERWCTASGWSSFTSFVLSWPNRCPLWIVVEIMSLADFLFALDAVRNWSDGTKDTPYANKMFSDVSNGEWQLLLWSSAGTFAISLSWTLVEIFRENKINKNNKKSDVETYVEGLSLLLLTLIWIITVFLTTIPGGAASLVGNLYFCGWGTLLSVVAANLWWVRDWREGIRKILETERADYDSIKRAIRSKALRERERRINAARNEDQLGDLESSDDVPDDTAIIRARTLFSADMGEDI